MQLKIENLTKRYGQQYAIRDVSFQVGQGEVVGFLGPNGAGKSTTMKIATQYIAPTSGRVLIDDVDIAEEPLQIKKWIGYLPEHNPLYLDLYVHEYLHFIGRLYGMNGATLANRIKEIVEMCGLTREQNKVIDSLSKGYRQRVGLAQALLHDPPILILDEPTTGLDPNQITEIRNLIKTIARSKTVLFSTHIMQEVQALCDRVVVINKGEIVADSSLAELLNRSGDDRVVVAEFEGNVDIEVLRQVSGVLSVQHLEGTRYRFTSRTDVDLRSEIFRLAAEKQLLLIGLKQEENSLEHIFKGLTAGETQS